MSFPETVGIVTSLFNTLFLIVGGLWAFRKFVQNREELPKARTSHQVTFKQVNDKTLLRIVVRVENIGKVLLTLSEGEVRVCQLLPFPEEVESSIGPDHGPLNGRYQFPWRSLKEWSLFDHVNIRKIEPGEVDEIHLDLLLEPEIATIEIGSYIRNQKISKARNFGWNCLTVHDVPPSGWQ